jgi:hypothetical protein
MTVEQILEGLRDPKHSRVKQVGAEAADLIEKLLHGSTARVLPDSGLSELERRADLEAETSRMANLD